MKNFTVIFLKISSFLDDPEFCFNRPLTLYEVPATVSFTVCGVPALPVLWINEQTKITGLIMGKPYANTSYAYTYSLNITNSMCGKRMHFFVVNHKGIALEWSPIMKSMCKLFSLLFQDHNIFIN